MHTGNSASDGPDDRQSATDGDHAVSRRTVLRGAAAAALGGTVLGFTSGGARADHAPPSDWTTITLDAEGASHSFGSALAFDAAGETLVVGDSTRQDGDVPTGGVSVYTAGENGWSRETVLDPVYSAELDYVGASVAVDAAGETIVVGAPGEDALAGQCGAVSVFVREAGAWNHAAKLTAGDEATNRDRLGRAVAVDAAGERVVAGAPADDADPARAGAAYVFDRTEESDGDTSWTRTTKLELPEGSAGDMAGASVAMAADGSTAVVGAPGLNDGAGGVAAFTDDPWGHVRTAENSGDTATAFGQAVATNGTDSVLCAPQAPQSSSDGNGDDSNAQSGAVGYAGVYGGVSLAAVQALSVDGGTTGERFGTDASLALDGDCAVVGAVAGDSAGSDDGGTEDGETEDVQSGDGSTPAGGALVFATGEDGWYHTSRLGPTDTGSVSRFGRAVAADGDGHRIAVGGQRGTEASEGGVSGTDTEADSESSATGTVTVFTRESPEITIDIEPDEEWPATVPYSDGGEVEVCIEHTDGFDPAAVDVGTLRFGPPRVVDEGDGARAVDAGSVEDADGDGDADLLVRFPADDAGFDPDDFAARLVGETIYGTPISDHDFVVTSEDGESSEGDSAGNGTGGSSGGGSSGNETGGSSTGNETSGDAGGETTPGGDQTDGNQTDGNQTGDGTDGGAL
ncbi:FG-GAP repeat protein [Halosimplex sp. J119]